MSRPPWEPPDVLFWGLVFGIIAFLASVVALFANYVQHSGLLFASQGVLAVTWVLAVICLLFSKRHL